jgi:thiamine pyrophosphate-dependent acetolactate synthase large subunit-like protein
MEFYPQRAAATRGVFYGVNIPDPNYAKLVEPFDGYGVRGEDPVQLKSALQSALAAANGGKLAVVDAVLAA